MNEETTEENKNLEKKFRLLYCSLAFYFALTFIDSVILKQEIRGIKPAIREEQVIGGPLPDRFYEIDGKRVYLEIDGRPVESYFTGREESKGIKREKALRQE